MRCVFKWLNLWINTDDALSSVVSVLGLSNLFTYLQIRISRTKYETGRIT